MGGRHAPGQRTDLSRLRVENGKAQHADNSPEPAGFVLVGHIRGAFTKASKTVPVRKIGTRIPATRAVLVNSIRENASFSAVPPHCGRIVFSLPGLPAVGSLLCTQPIAAQELIIGSKGRTRTISKSSIPYFAGSSSTIRHNSCLFFLIQHYFLLALLLAVLLNFV